MARVRIPILGNVLTDHGELKARNVVIATGPYQRPQVPQLSAGFPADIVQLHASEYRNPSALPAGAVLVGPRLLCNATQ